MIFIIIDTTNRRIKRILRKLKQNKSQLSAFIAWAFLTALCLTILVFANHAVETIAARLNDDAAPAMADKRDEDAENTESAETCPYCKKAEGEHGFGDGNSDPSCKRKHHHHRRRHSDLPETAAETAPYGCDTENQQSNAETQSPNGGSETAAPNSSASNPSANSETEQAPAETSAKPTAEPAKSGYSTKSYDWYFKTNNDHARPPLPAEFNFIKQHDTYWIGKEGVGKTIYLTFDAGYENGNVRKILDILKDKGVPATFFILENLAKREPELVKRMADEGHLIGNHTATHKDMTKLTDDEFAEELFKLERAEKEYAGVDVAKFYRPPMGTFSERDLALAKKLGYKTIMWSYAYADWDNNAQPQPDKALELLLGHTHEGMVLLLHPTSATNAEILDDFIDRLKSDGWRFGTLTELTS